MWKLKNVCLLFFLSENSGKTPLNFWVFFCSPSLEQSLTEVAARITNFDDLDKVRNRKENLLTLSLFVFSFMIYFKSSFLQ